ncbi:MAG: sporulation protein [Candidatus Eremiobacteraeota bacterium]|nr:sporulation protein [Candidatus Eremiobacteraeota bacterium]
MAFFRKALASIGIGNAKVDTIIESTEILPGGTLVGKVTMEGGKVEQQVNSIYLELLTDTLFYETREVVTRDYEDYDGDGDVDHVHEHTDHEERESIRSLRVLKVDVAENFVLKPGEQKEIPFEIPIPIHMPASFLRSQSRLATGLDISMAVDPRDTDAVEVQPCSRVSVLLEAMSSLGMSLSDCVTEHCEDIDPHEFLQMFEFHPGGGPFYGRVDNIEIRPVPEEHTVRLYIETDKKGRGVSGWFSELMNTDQVERAVDVSNETFQAGPQAVAQVIRETVEAVLN